MKKEAVKHRSHPKKWLEDHINGVISKTVMRTDSPVAFVAALFHDLGKLNPNFQLKLNGTKVSEYSNHSLLSAAGLICFIFKNRDFLKKWFSEEQNIAMVKFKMVLAVIIAHHGNLPNLGVMINDEATAKDNLLKFLTTQTDESFPASDFLEVIFLEHFTPFQIFDIEELWQFFLFNSKNDEPTWEANALGYFMETQFSFAALIESDKRDAGYNENFELPKQIEASISELHSSLETAFANLTSNSDLNLLRTAIREEAIVSLREKMESGHRVFSLTAPTGAGKTYTLLALAKEIQCYRPECSILYALPFLSIIEQVESIVLGFFGGKKESVLSFHSKSINETIQRAQEALENDPSEEMIDNVLKQDFSASTFDHPFILTTFVQFFETLMSNHNSTLLKLPNFQKRIFLIDEIQALPPRLYIFFAAWLDTFCKKFDAFCILSTATMPFWEIAESKGKVEARKLFKNYQQPFELLDAKKFFNQKPFNRYKVNWFGEDDIEMDLLFNEIKNQSSACLVILNTIDDTKHLYDRLKDGTTPCILLNTHFTPFDRRAKIDRIKTFLDRKEKIILVSTQLIEAGVDVDFPVIYRDLCPLPSLIQSAGRCNRNAKLDFGQVYFFRLKKDNGKYSSSLVYREDASQFLKFSLKHIKGKSIEERELFEIQKSFFKTIGEGLTIGKYDECKIPSMVDCVMKAQFKDLGKFQLIPELEFGKQYTYFIPESNTDQRYFELEKLVEKLGIREGYKPYKMLQIKVEQLMKSMAERMVNVRVKDETQAPQPQKNGVMGIRCLIQPEEFYSEELGIKLGDFANLIF
jgi:CRISPR-associated endonuclease/helicase Cas3